MHRFCQKPGFLRLLGDGLARHPAVRDALLWSIPAVLVGVVVRMLLLSYQPFAYWGSDSGSYFWFAQRLLLEGQISLPAKRHFLYPLFLVPVAVLPGATLSVLAWVQHAFGLATVFAVGYCIRKVFDWWRVWILPVTLLFATLPVLIWYEHELIGESLFAHTLAWAFAGWLAWDGRGRTASAWWFFLIPFAACILTKSAGRFFWPGILLGLVATRAWKHLRWPQWAATGVLFAISWTMGESSQGVRLLYTTAFPLTVLGSPAHAGLKSEIRTLVEESRAELASYHLKDSRPKEFLRSGLKDRRQYPQWAALARDEDHLWGVVKDLALEAVGSSPLDYASIAGRRTMAAMDLSGFRSERFSADYFPLRFDEAHAEMLDRGELGRRLSVLLFGASPDTESLNPFAEPLRVKDSGLPSVYAAAADKIHQMMTPVVAAKDGQIFLTFSGWWLLAACLIALHPSLFPRLGVWLAVVLGYALGVHFLGSSNPRFLVPIWSVLCIAAALPADRLLDTVWTMLFPHKIPA